MPLMVRIPLSLPFVRFVRVAFFGVPLLLAALLLVACAPSSCSDRGAEPTAEPPPATAEPAPAAPALDATRVHALLAENAPSVTASVATRGEVVALELGGGGAPAVALAMLGSLEPLVPGLRASKLKLDPDSWTAVLATSGIPSTAPDALGSVIAAVTPAFDGEASLFRAAAVEVAGGRLVLQGELLPGRGIADAAAVVPSGFALAKVEAGPPFVVELTRASP
jgi:hypothetical protein